MAIKIHWGEVGNLAYLAPPLVRSVVDIVKECGGTIDAVPDAPHGTCFVLRFPLIEATNASTASIDGKTEPSHE